MVVCRERVVFLWCARGFRGGGGDPVCLPAAAVVWDSGGETQGENEGCPLFYLDPERADSHGMERARFCRCVLGDSNLAEVRPILG